MQVIKNIVIESMLRSDDEQEVIEAMSQCQHRLDDLCKGRFCIKGGQCFRESANNNVNQLSQIEKLTLDIDILKAATHCMRDDLNIKQTKLDMQDEHLKEHDALFKMFDDANGIINKHMILVEKSLIPKLIDLSEKIISRIDALDKEILTLKKDVGNLVKF